MGCADRTAWFPLRSFLHLSVKLGSRSLIEPRLADKIENPDRLQYAQRARGIGICRVFRRFKADLHMALRGEVIDFVRLHRLNDADQIGGIRHVPVMNLETGVRCMGILVNMVDARRIERRRAALDAMYKITFAQQKIGQICAVLPGNACD
jgi:hypothetical protein